MRRSALLKVLLGSGVAGLLITGCYYDVNYIAGRCERRVEKTVDPAALQVWATNLLDHYAITKTNYGGPFPAFPALKHIWDEAPPSVCILGGDNQGEEFVCVIWGSAAGHWGMSIGKLSFIPVIPERGGRMWKSGVYFWRDPH